VESDTVTVWQR